MVDFESKRVQDLFKDEEKAELKEGITIRDINSIASMTPINRNDLQGDLQRAYKLISEQTNSEMEKLGATQKKSSSNTQVPTPNSTLGSIPSVSKMLQQNSQTPEKNPLAEQLADAYNKMQENKLAEQKQETAPRQQQLSSYQDYVNRIEELEKLNEDKNKEIKILKNEKEEMINQQYELENKHLEKYKELNNKYEDLQEEVAKHKESNGGSLVEYLKETNERLEQKQSLLLQEIGKLKGMLGI